MPTPTFTQLQPAIRLHVQDRGEGDAIGVIVHHADPFIAAFESGGPDDSGGDLSWVVALDVTGEIVRVPARAVRTPGGATARDYEQADKVV